jgi:hypothetical protein
MGKAATTTTTLTLLDLLDELGMDPSRSHKGKGARNERELLRYKAHVGEITAPTGGWKWSPDDKELPVVRSVLVGYRDRNLKAPSGWRNLPPCQQSPCAASNQDDAVGEGRSERREVKQELYETKEEPASTSQQQQPHIKHEQSRTAEQSTTRQGVKREVSKTKEEVASTSQQQPRIKHEQTTTQRSTARRGVKRELSETKEEVASTLQQQPRIKHEQSRTAER